MHRRGNLVWRKGGSESGQDHSSLHARDTQRAVSRRGPVRGRSAIDATRRWVAGEVAAGTIADVPGEACLVSRQNPIRMSRRRRGQRDEFHVGGNVVDA